MRRSFALLVVIAGLLVACSGQTTAPAASEAPLASGDLTITSPADGSVTDAKEIMVGGTAPDGAEVVRDIPFASDDRVSAAGGRWTMALKLDEGENALTFRIGDDESTAKTVTVIYRPVAAATAEPTSGPTPKPTPTPEPTPRPTATPKPTPVPPILAKSGRGDKVLKFRAQDGPIVARISNKGGSNFAVISYSGTDYDDLLVNTIGSYSGRVYVAPGVNLLKITSSGSWSVELRPITSAPKWNGTSTLTGKGDSVILLRGGAFGTTAIKNRGRDNFAVIAYSEYGDYLDLLVNEIGSYSGEVLLPAEDPIVLSIHAEGGSWSLSAVQ